MPHNERRILIAKIIIVSLLAAVSLYCLYAVIGQFAIWLTQPRFVRVSDGARTASAGFVMQTLAFLGIFLGIAAATVFLCIRFFKRKKTADKNDPPPTE